jgi:hypothetical protein
MQRFTGCAGLLWDFQQIKAPMYGWNLYFTVKKDFSASTPSKFQIFNILCYIHLRLALGSPAKGGAAFKPGFAKSYVKPAVAEKKGESSKAPHIKSKAGFMPVLDYNAKGMSLLYASSPVLIDHVSPDLRWTKQEIGPKYTAPSNKRLAFVYGGQ